MLIECKGIQTGKYFIPPFSLKEKEVIVIYLSRTSQDYFNAMKELVDVFTGKLKRKGVIVTQPLRHVDYFHEPKMRELFYPVTVKEYLKKKANQQNNIGQQVYEGVNIKPTTKVNTLGYDGSKLLSLYATLSHTSNIVFDLTAQSPDGGIETYEIVKRYVKNGGAAILIDWIEEMKNDCTQFITASVIM